jgi:hypothetical protein
MHSNHLKLPIRVIVFVAATLHLSATYVFAQQEKPKEESIREVPKRPGGAPTKAPVKKKGGVIQLEAVIRGNQQQPKVLTIVPWQSPGRKNTLPSPVWQQVKQQLQPLERRDFLQEQRLFEKLLKK